MFGNPYQPQQPYQNGFQNPYLDRLNALSQPQMTQPQRYEIIQVTGENGARAFRMAPNSRCLLLDETAPIVWLAQTDGGGYPTLTPYSITPYQAQNPQANIEDRLTRLEALVYGKSDASAASQVAGPDANVGTKQPDGNASAVPTVPTANGRS